jgi:hypothetical protein
LNWFLYRVRDRDLVLVFYMWISNFPNTLCWRGCLFSSMYFWHFCQKSDDNSCVDLFLDLLFFSIGLHVCFCACPMWFLFQCFAVWFELRILTFLCVPLHVQDCFGCLGSFIFLYEFLGFFYFCDEWNWNFDGDFIEHINHFQ